MLCWLIFAFAFFFRTKPPQSAKQKKDRTSMFGVALVGVGFALVWSVQRQIFTPIIETGIVLEIILAFVTVIISSGSVWLVLSSVRTLGKQWTVTAQTVENHKFITDGPYRYVRNPIYAGMLGMIVATGLIMSTWYALLIALFCGWAGTMIRIRSEEKLLLAAFGEEFILYTRKVPALFPKLF